MQIANLQMRWTIGSDVPWLLAVERACFDEPLTEKDFLELLHDISVIGWTALHEGIPVGYMLRRIHPESMEIISMAVHPEYRKRGIGRAFIETYCARPYLDAPVCNSLTAGQDFLRHLGFRAVQFIRVARGQDGRDQDVVILRRATSPQSQGAKDGRQTTPRA